MYVIIYSRLVDLVCLFEFEMVHVLLLLEGNYLGKNGSCFAKLCFLCTDLQLIIQ